MDDDATSDRGVAKMCGRPGFVVFATGGDLELPAETKARRTGCPKCGAAYSCTCRASKNPTEAVNPIIERTRRLGHAFRSCSNYRLLLPRGGIRWDNRRAPRLRMRKLRLVA